VGTRMQTVSRTEGQCLVPLERFIKNNASKWRRLIIIIIILLLLLLLLLLFRQKLMHTSKFDKCCEPAEAQPVSIFTFKYNGTGKHVKNLMMTIIIILKCICRVKSYKTNYRK
jgi:hypothetical protein